MTPPTLLQPPEVQRDRSRSRRLRPGRSLSAVASTAALLLVIQMMQEPRNVTRIHIVNPTAYDLAVEVTDAGHDGWMPVWTAKRDATTVAEEIYDIGDTWIFRFSAQGKTTGELRVERSALERTGWRLTIPTRFGDALRDQGAPPPP